MKIKPLLRFFFIILVLGLITFFDRFAKIKINILNVPLYITELFILGSIFLILFISIINGKIKYFHYPLNIYFLLFYLIFLISLILGWIFYEDKIYVLRQSAIFYYSIFYFLFPLLFHSWDTLKKFFKIIFILYLFWPAVMLFFNIGDRIGFFAYFYCPIFITFELLYLKFVSQKIRWLFLIAITGQLLIFILAKARAAWMGAFFAGFFVLYLIQIRRFSGRLLLKIVNYIFIITVFLLLITLIFKPSIIENVLTETATILIIAPDDSNESERSVLNALWRLYVWKDIINETLEKPILGWGFGKKFIPPTIKELGWGGSWRDPEKGFQDPHNSFLSIFHRTGFLGISIFLLIIVKFIFRTLNLVKKISDEKIKTLIIASLISIVYVLGVSFFMVVLEGPYLGISLWVLMGLIVSLERIYRKSQVIR